MAVKHLKPRFVDAFPEKMDEGVLYVALEYTTMSHLCACGCGSEVVTPLSPNDWQFTYNGDSISVSPSIGSWSLACESHYVIHKGAIRWAEKWDKETIQAGRDRDRANKVEASRERTPAQTSPKQAQTPRPRNPAPTPRAAATRAAVPPPPRQPSAKKKGGFWSSIRRGLGLD